MPRKTFYDCRMPIGILALVLMGGGSLVLAISAVVMIVGYIEEAFSEQEAILGAVFYLFFSLLCAWCTRCLSFRMLPQLTLKGETIIWKCPFHKNQKVNVTECLYVTVEDMNDHYKLPLVRGDEASFIWLSNQPFPSQFKHKADNVKCKSGSIIFPYSNKVAEALVEILPKDRTNQLHAFYYQIKWRERQLQNLAKRKKGKKK